MNPNEFQNSFKHWIESVTKRTKGQVVAIDGKTLRRSHDKSEDKKANYILALKENHKTLFDETVDGNHDRIETREVKGECSYENRYDISRLECDAKKFGEAVRSHWGIENSVHWVLDIAFREDESRIRKGCAPENFAAIRHIALICCAIIKHLKAV
jgi:predicted transposase YbfD/YdcC